MKTVAVMLLAGASVFAAPTFNHDNDFSGLNPRQAQRIRAAITMFDKNHNGKLERDEREAFMKALGEMIR
jgi:Ca2+-binding EF-hand superfamily protein